MCFSDEHTVLTIASLTSTTMKILLIIKLKCFLFYFSMENRRFQFALNTSIKNRSFYTVLIEEKECSKETNTSLKIAFFEKTTNFGVSEKQNSEYLYSVFVKLNNNTKFSRLFSSKKLDMLYKTSVYSLTL